MRIYIIRSTGELEAAIIAIIGGYKGIILDFTNKNFLIRNKKLVKLFENIKYYQPHSRLEKILIIISLILRSLVISANSYGFTKIRLLTQNIFNVYFIRDALVPRESNIKYINLICEKYYSNYYPFSKVLLIPNYSSNKFIETIKKSINKEVIKNYDCLVIGKSMKRTPEGIRLKKKIYEILKNKFKKIAVIPHPRESNEEIEMISKMGMSIENELIYNGKNLSKKIMILCGSTALVYDIFNIKYYYIEMEEFFIYRDLKRSIICKNSLGIIKNIEQLEKFNFNNNNL